jgi:hypothetical protein
MNVSIVKLALSGSTSAAVPAFAAGLHFTVHRPSTVAPPDALRQKSMRTSTGAVSLLARRLRGQDWGTGQAR